jgi:hypothetical protein
MSDDQRKGPFANSAPSEDDEWDKALDAWDAGDETEKKPAPAPPKEPPAPAKGPLYRPPSQQKAPELLPTPIPPERRDLPKPFASFSDDDEPTTISRVPAELLAGTTTVRPLSGSGLGHVLRRDAAQPPGPLHDPFSGNLFGTTDSPPSRPSEDLSVITSAPTLAAHGEPHVSEQERRRGDDLAYLDVPEGGLFDPFAALGDEKALTVRPGAPVTNDAAPREVIEVSMPNDAASVTIAPGARDDSLRFDKTPAPSSEPPLDELLSADLGLEEPAAPKAERPARLAVAPPGSEERTWLGEKAKREAWASRASWLEEEARAATDRGVKARGVLVVSELLALAGEQQRAHELALEARDLSPNHPLPHRQARALPLQERDHDRLTQLLDAESRSASAPLARAHAALFAAALARMAQGDRESLQKRLDQAMRALPSDPRAYVDRLVSAIADGAALPKVRWPDASELAPLAAATATLSRWRGSGDRPPSIDVHPADLLLSARAALAGRDPVAVLGAVDALGAATGLGDAAAWLAVAFALVRPNQEGQAIARLERLTDGKLGRIARRTLIAHALERGDKERARAMLDNAPADTFDAVDRALLGVLAEAEPQRLRVWLDALGRDAAGRAALAPLRAAVGLPSFEPPKSVETDATAGDPWVRLARLLASHATEETLIRAVPESDGGSANAPLRQVLGAELDIALGRVAALAESFAKAGAAAETDGQRDNALLAALLFELRADERARAQYEAARAADPSCEAALRAQIALSAAETHAELLAAYGAALEDPTASSLALLEAAHAVEARGGDDERYATLLRAAQERAPSLPFASFLAERQARARGEFDTIVEWLRERQNATDDAVEKAYDLAREALLIADRDIDAAKDLLDRASRARVRDFALRELYEKLSPESPPDRATFWADRALAAEGAERARLALIAALEFERTGQHDDAARFAQISLEAEDSKLTRLCVERNEALGSFATNLAERLIHVAKGDGDPAARLEAYQRLADLDEIGRGDAASAVLWHQSILEEHPHFLPSLRRLEQWLIEGGRDDELELIAAAIAKAAKGGEAVAHAHLAMRLKSRAGPWRGSFEFVKLAYQQKDPPLWAMREMEAHAAVANDAAAELDVSRRLLALTRRPLESATLALRAADAAMRADDMALANELLAAASKAYPNHLIVQRTLAELADKGGDFSTAADAWEAVAGLSLVPEHQLEASFRAGVLYVDHLDSKSRGRAALETAAKIDITYQDLFARLQAIYVAEADSEALAALLEARLAGVTDPNERVELEIVRGRTLAEIGDLPAAKRALEFALDASPDHPSALKAFADLAAREGDWDAAEQALIRLVRLVADSAEQAELYMRLGDLYDQNQPNPERAELAYREVLRRLPGDEKSQERLVEIYTRTGDVAKAVEAAQALQRSAATPEGKRKRTIDLARVYEQVARDPKKSEALLETARKEAPGDVELLAALASFYRRSGKGPAVTLLLDRTASDARRALSTGRFELGLFSTLATVARLRERTEAAAIAEATLAAVEGRPSELRAAGTRAADPGLDDAIAPDLLAPAFRALLAKAGEVLDAGAPVDMKGLRVMPLPLSSTGAFAETKDLARAFGLGEVEIFVSPALGAVCLPASSFPPQIVLGQPLLASSEDAVRRFLLTRALKIVRAKACALSRSAPIDLAPLVYAFLLLFAPDWQPSNVDANKLRDMHGRLLRAKPERLEPDIGLLALEVIGALGNRTSTLHTIVNGWGNRVALLACGDLSTALSAIARAAGHSSGPAASGTERVTWIGRNAEARDLVVFTMSDAYAEVRAKLGV